MNKGQKITVGIIAFVVIVLVGYDIYAVVNKESHNDTLSWIILQFSWRAAIVPYLAGVISGHFFIPIEKLKGFLKPIIFISALVSGMGISMLFHFLPFYYPAIPFFFGIIMGLIFWNQGKKKQKLG